VNNPVLCDRRHPITLFLFLFVKRQTRRKKNIFLTLQSVQLIIPCLDKVVKCVAYCKSSSSVIAETAGVTFSLSASVEYRHTVEQCTDIQDLPITSQYELRNECAGICSDEGKLPCENIFAIFISQVPGPLATRRHKYIRAKKNPHGSGVSQTDRRIFHSNG